MSTVKDGSILHHSIKRFNFRVQFHASIIVYGRENTFAAMQYCQGLSLYSANDLRDAAEMVGSQQTQAQPSRLPVEDERYHIPVQKRDLSVYGDVISRNGVTK